MEFSPKPVIENTNPKLKSICNTSKYPNIPNLHKTFQVLINPQVGSRLEQGSAGPENMYFPMDRNPNSTHISVWFSGSSKCLGLRESYIRSCIQNLK